MAHSHYAKPFPACRIKNLPRRHTSTHRLIFLLISSIAWILPYFYTILQYGSLLESCITLYSLWNVNPSIHLIQEHSQSDVPVYSELLNQACSKCIAQNAAAVTEFAGTLESVHWIVNQVHPWFTVQCTLISVLVNQVTGAAFSGYIRVHTGKFWEKSKDISRTSKRLLQFSRTISLWKIMI